MKKPLWSQVIVEPLRSWNAPSWAISRATTKSNAVWIHLQRSSLHENRSLEARLSPWEPKWADWKAIGPESWWAQCSQKENSKEGAGNPQELHSISIFDLVPLRSLPESLWFWGFFEFARSSQTQHSTVRHETCCQYDKTLQPARLISLNTGSLFRTVSFRLRVQYSRWGLQVNIELFQLCTLIQPPLPSLLLSFCQANREASDADSSLFFKY